MCVEEGERGYIKVSQPVFLLEVVTCYLHKLIELQVKG